MSLIDETARVRSLVLDLPDWPGHKAGQHVDVRLTGEDGYQAQRSYSIASAPESKNIILTVERIEDGEVSPYLTIDVQKSDKFELRGPIGGHFVWTTALGGPLFLIAGGSGVAPLMAMLRHRAARTAMCRQPCSIPRAASRTSSIAKNSTALLPPSDGLKVVHTLTRKQPPGWSGGARRIDRAMIESEGFPAAAKPRIFICGPTQLVESAAQIMLDLGHDRTLIKTERFGPTGG